MMPDTVTSVEVTNELATKIEGLTKVYGEELKTLDGRQAKKCRKEHRVELSEYGEIRRQVLEFYPSATFYSISYGSDV